MTTSIRDEIFNDVDIKLRAKIRKIRCVICLAEEFDSMKDALIANRNNISKEEFENNMTEFVKVDDGIDRLIMSTSGRDRLVCSNLHFEHLIVRVGGIKQMRRVKKCLNSKCKHTQAMHEGDYGECSASRCKCYRFISELSEQRLGAPKALQEIIAEAEANYKNIEDVPPKVIEIDPYAGMTDDEIMNMERKKRGIKIEPKQQEMTIKELAEYINQHEEDIEPLKKEPQRFNFKKK